MASLFDEAREAGFTDAEIGEWAARNREDWRAAGFSDQEIDTALTGAQNPRRLPSSFIARAGHAVGEQFQHQFPFLTRMGKAGIEGFEAGFGEAPLGPPEEEMAKLRAVRDVGLIPGTRAVDEALVEAAYTSLQLLFRGLQGATYGLGAMSGELAGELTGGNEA